jgi:hypothetical protein
MVICLIDNSEFDSVEHLHLYLRKLKVKQSDYYTKYIKRTDLLTGEPIPFKNPEQYINSDFANKNNLKKYVKENPERGKEWAINFLRKRKIEKGLKFAPTQVELRSLQCPSIPYYDSIGGYNKICKELGFKIRFKSTKLEFIPLPTDAKIIIDSREQKPLRFSRATETATVKEGDYALTEPYDKQVYIERKALLDFIGTLSKDLGRFHRELQRAKKKKSYIVMVVENDINDAMGFEDLTGIPGIKYVKTNSAHIFKNLRDTLVKFTNFQVLFVSGRKEASNAVIKIFELGESVKDIDLELQYELGNLKLDN